MKKREVVVTHAVRTAIGTRDGALRNASSNELASCVFRAIIDRSGIDPNLVDGVLMGQTKPSTRPMNVARYAWLEAGLPDSVPASTSYRACCSGVQSIFDAVQTIAYGDADIMIAGGVDSLNKSVYNLRGARYGVGHKNAVFMDTLTEHSACTIPPAIYGKHTVGWVADHIAEEWNVTREEQDQLALQSHNRALEAIEKGYFKEQIVPFKGFDTDEHPKHTSMEKLAKLKPSFSPTGTVTAGNASGQNDAAACVLMMTREKAEELGLKPELRFVSAAAVALDPLILLMGPMKAVPEALEIAGLKMSDIGLVEMNEAFASSSIASMRELVKLDEKETYEALNARTNINGSGISLGHPPGATAAMMVTRLLYDMKRLNIRYGLQTMCVGGGHGFASIWERID